MATERKPRNTQEAETLHPSEFVKNLDFSDITIVLPFIPPSVNDLYFNNRHGGRTLTKAGQVFKTRVKEHLATNYLDEVQKLNPNGMYSMSMYFHLDKDEVFTKSYLDNPKTQSPYKRRDVGNMEKILVDCIKEFTMKDDCQIFHESLWKIASNERKVRIHLSEIDPRKFIEGHLSTEEVDDLVRKINTYRNQAN